VSKQTEAYSRWSEARDNELERQVEAYRNEARREEVTRRQKEMVGQEEKLFFFDRQEEFEQRKEEREINWKIKLPPRTWTRRIKLKKKESVKDDYVPPDVKGRKL